MSVAVMRRTWRATRVVLLLALAVALVFEVLFVRVVHEIPQEALS